VILAKFPAATNSFAQASATITIVNPCLALGELEFTDQSQYTAMPNANVQPGVVIDPPVCINQIEAECQYEGGMYQGDLDLCNFDDGDSSAHIDPWTGEFDFDLIDNEMFPPGSYVFLITVRVGDKVVTGTFDITIEDPCPVADVTITNHPFLEGPYVYNLGNETPLELPFTLSTIGESDTPVHCGVPKIEFLTVFGDEIPIFMNADMDREVFQVGPVYVPEAVLAYDIVFRYFYTNNPDNYKTSESFRVQVVEGCKAGKMNLITPYFEPQTYVIGMPAINYLVPSWEAIPVYCGVAFNMIKPTMTAPGLSAALQFDGTHLRIFYDVSVDLAGETMEGTTYQITFTQTVEDVTDSATLSITLVNPCLDAALIGFSTEPLPTKTYVIYDTFDNTWEHQPFISDLTATVDALCGGISYTLSIDDDASIRDYYTDAELDEMLTYDTATHTFTMLSNKMSVIGEMFDYSLNMFLTNFPDCTTCGHIATGTITIVSPCDFPVDLTTGVPQDIDTDGGSDAVFTFPDVHVTPPSCLQYAHYFCVYQSGPYTGTGDHDLCHFNMNYFTDHISRANFDSDSGSFNFFSNDSDVFPAGDYFFDLGVTIGDKTSQFTIKMIIHGHCNVP
jgi:hypothetical protein